MILLPFAALFFCRLVVGGVTACQPPAKAPTPVKERLATAFLFRTCVYNTGQQPSIKDQPFPIVGMVYRIKGFIGLAGVFLVHVSCCSERAFCIVAVWLCMAV